MDLKGPCIIMSAISLIFKKQIHVSLSDREPLDYIETFGKNKNVWTWWESIWTRLVPTKSNPKSFKTLLKFETRNCANFSLAASPSRNGCETIARILRTLRSRFLNTAQTCSNNLKHISKIRKSRVHELQTEPPLKTLVQSGASCSKTCSIKMRTST